jgi:hypothetical protein
MTMCANGPCRREWLVWRSRPQLLMPPLTKTAMSRRVRLDSSVRPVRNISSSSASVIGRITGKLSQHALVLPFPCLIPVHVKGRLFDDVDVCDRMIEGQLNGRQRLLQTSDALGCHVSDKV